MSLTSCICAHSHAGLLTFNAPLPSSLLYKVGSIGGAAKMGTILQGTHCVQATISITLFLLINVVFTATLQGKYD